MRPIERAIAVILAASLAPLALSSCGGCGGGRATRDTGRWCDGGCRPPPAQVAWDHAIFPTPHDEIDVCDAVMLPTGIAILAPPYILLADKTDGHLIAKAPWPTGRNGISSSCGPAIARSNGNVVVLTEDYPSSGDQLAIHEYAGSDLSSVKDTALSQNVGLSVIGESGGEIYVLSHAGPTVDTLYLYVLPDGGSAQTQILASGDGTASLRPGSFATTPDGGLLTCGSYFKSGPPAVLRIDPPKTMTKTLSFSGGTGSEVCRLLPGPDRDLVIWDPAGPTTETEHWEMVSRDGTRIIADATGPIAPGFLIAYGEGAFVSVSGSRLYVTDPDTAATRGPYSITPTDYGMGASAIASDGNSLWVAYDVYLDSVHLLKLGPLPK